jgi:enterochelin esterase-like enzyme
MHRHRLQVTLALALITASCSSGSEPAADDSTTTAPTSSSTTAATGAPGTTSAETTTSASEVTSSSSSPEAAFTKTSDIVYMTVNGDDLLINVYTPVGDGPWPVVVAFHGLDSNMKDGTDTTQIAEEAATRGMLVYAPSWLDLNATPFPFTRDVFDTWRAVTNCALAFAQQHAASHGGDAASTVIYGFSAGAGASLIASVEPTMGPIGGFATDASAIPAIGVVLGDGEYFLHSENFEAAFDTDLEAMQAEVASLVDPTSWPPDLNAKFYLWIAQDGTGRRGFADPYDDGGWLALRDPTGSIRADLERLDQLGDGVISNIDAGQLLQLRLEEAGLDVTLDQYPGGHTVGNKVPELVDYFEAALAD